MAMGPQEFIADGFADDCDELIHQCLKETPVTYSAFSKVFRSMQMSCVFHERHSGAEIAELTEELINIAKYYMMANTSNYETSVVGLFLVYALIKLQPFEDFAYLRIAEDDVQYIERIEIVARREKRLDVLYILGTVLTQHTRYTAAVRERGMEPSYRKYLENFSSLENLGQRPKGVFLRQNEELDIIKELSAIQLRYDSAKVAVNVPELKYVDTKFASELNSSLKNIVSGIIETETASESEDEPLQETARTIKEKAMKIKVNPMRHLVALNDRSPTKRNISIVSDIKTSPGKIKTGSPTKSVTSKRQTAANAPKRKPQKRKRPSSSSCTDDDSDMSLELSNDDDDSDIDLTKFNKPQSISKTSNKTDDVIEVEIGSKDLNLGNLPCLITSDDNGLSYEIEIIDQSEESTKQTNTKPVTNEDRQEIDNSDESNKQTGCKPYTNEDRQEIDTSKESTKKMQVKPSKPVFRSSVDHEIKLRKEKKDLKKPILKSRFKRMGMDTIANFKTK